MSMRMILELCAALYALVILLELVLRRRLKRFLLETTLLVLVVVLALMINNASTGSVSFGRGTSPAGTVVIMFAATVLGIAARYVFYLQKGQFSSLDLLKPLVITPIVLLPLIGSVQTTEALSSMQVLSFGVLAFQNGFFWQAVLEGARPARQVSGESDQVRQTR